MHRDKYSPRARCTSPHIRSFAGLSRCSLRQSPKDPGWFYEVLADAAKAAEL